MIPCVEVVQGPVAAVCGEESGIDGVNIGNRDRGRIQTS